MQPQPTHTIQLTDQRSNPALKALQLVVLYAYLGLLVYVSYENKVWSFFLGIMFLMTVLAMGLAQIKTRLHKFQSLDELEQWVKQERRFKQEK